jgi:hypothetical protein
MSAEDAPVSVTPIVASVRPDPSDEEVAAIVAAIEAGWPKPVVAAAATTERPNTWRFSGRWWSRPVPARRDRPYR